MLRPIAAAPLMVAALNAERDASPEAAIHNVQNAVLSFMNGAEQFDDMTMMCLRYNGKITENE